MCAGNERSPVRTSRRHDAAAPLIGRLLFRLLGQETLQVNN